MNCIEKWESEVRLINEQVAPIANAPVGFETLDVSFDTNQRKVLAIVLDSAQPILRELIDEYLSSENTIRQKIRELFSQHTSFAWAVYYQMHDNSCTEVRRYLAFLSITDQGRDTRDFLMQCSAVFDKFDEQGISYKDELAEVIAISSTENKYGMGSTASILRRWC